MPAVIYQAAYRMHCIDAAYCYTLHVPWSLCLCVLGTLVCQIGAQLHIGAIWRIRLNNLCTAATQLYVRLQWSLVNVSILLYNDVAGDKQVWIQPPTCADNVTLPAFARRCCWAPAVHWAHSSKPATAGLLLSAHAGTDGRTDTLPFHIPCSAYCAECQ